MNEIEMKINSSRNKNSPKHESLETRSKTHRDTVREREFKKDLKKNANTEVFSILPSFK